MESCCPYLQSEGKSCCPFEKLSNPIYVGVIFVVFNLTLILIDVYEIGVVSLVSYGLLFGMVFKIAHVKLCEFMKGTAEEKKSSEW